MVFDLDGTLLDTLDDIADAANAALEELGHPTHPTAAYRYFVGEGMEMLIRRILPEAARAPEEITAGVEVLRRQYDRRWDHKTRPYAGVPELLDALAARGLPLAVLSNKPDDFTRLTVGRLLARWDFAAVHGMRPDTPRKPDPAGALAVARALGLPPARFLYLGDTATDMQTATAAGMKALGATWGFRPADELLAAGADALVDRPSQLLDHLPSHEATA